MVQNDQHYTSKIIKAGALISDTKLTLTNWREDESVAENLTRLQEENVYGKASRNRIQQMLNIFRERYLANSSIRYTLIRYVNSQMQDDSLRLILFYHAAKVDPVIYDTMNVYLSNIQRQGFVSINTQDFTRVLKKWNEEGKMTTHWGENTLNRVARNLATTLRDFGILQGAVNKKIANFRMPLPTFVHVAFLLHQENSSGTTVLNHPDWNLFFLTTPSVERLFLEAHQLDLLTYFAAGSTIRLSFPANNLEEYADVIIQRSS